ncbi:MAG: Bug family tripartite tricarboxylate transporter substrate binding protein [Beijerinckiaceae bacterium]
MKSSKHRSAGSALRIACMWSALAASAAVAPAYSQESQDKAAQFYRGKTVNLIVPFAPGGYYDTGARLVGRHIGNHIPGKPRVVVQNQPGAGGLGLANRFGAGAGNDGLTIGVLQRGLPLLALTGDKNVRFDPLTMNWLGSISAYSQDAFVLAVNTSAGVKSAAEVLNGSGKLKIGGNQSGSTNLTLALIAREILGFKYEIVRGYRGASQINMAQQSGEVDGQFADLSFFKTNMRAQWQGGKLVPIVQLGRRERLAELKDVPTARELVTDPKKKAFLIFAESPFFMALPVAAPVGIPAERVAALKAAFVAMGKDPAFLGEAKKINYVVDPISGDAVLDIVKEAAKTPRDVIEQYKQIIAK